MIKDLSWLKISDVFAPTIRQIIENCTLRRTPADFLDWGFANIRWLRVCHGWKYPMFLPQISDKYPKICCKMRISWYKDLGKSTNLQQNREISDIRIDYNISDWCRKCTKYPKISSRISARALVQTNTSFFFLVFQGPKFPKLPRIYIPPFF